MRTRVNTRSTTDNIFLRKLHNLSKFIESDHNLVRLHNYLEYICNFAIDLTEGITRNDIEALQQMKIIYNSCIDLGKINDNNP